MTTDESDSSTRDSHYPMIACISETELKIAMAGNKPHSLQIGLWDWLRDSSVNPLDLLECLKSGRLGHHRYSGYQGQEPYITLLKSLPGFGNPAEPNVRRVLVQRLGIVIQMMANDRQLVDSMNIPAWCDLIDFSRRICDPTYLTKPVMELLSFFDAEQRVPFPQTHGCAHSFTRLVADLQPDNRLHDRWMDIVRGSADSVLSADLFEAWQGLLKQPILIPFGSIEEAAYQCCVSLEESISDEAARERVGSQFANVQTTSNSTILTLAMARLWNDFDWLPIPHPLVFAISAVRDLAFVGQLVFALDEMKSPMKELATMMHRILADDSHMCVALRDFLSLNTQQDFGWISKQLRAGSESNLKREELSDRQLRRYLEQSGAVTPEIMSALTRLRTIADAIKHGDSTGSKPATEGDLIANLQTLMSEIPEPFQPICEVYYGRAVASMSPGQRKPLDFRLSLPVKSIRA